MSEVVVLAAIDCLRADHVSAYGYHRQTTPTLDALAEQGVLWEQASSASNRTKPAVASYLTGLYPTQHGAFEGIKRSKGRRPATTDRVRCEKHTRADRFAHHGRRCAAFINNAQLGRFAGLDRGFHCYEPEAGKADQLHTLRRLARRPARAGRGCSRRNRNRPGRSPTTARTGVGGVREKQALGAIHAPQEAHDQVSPRSSEQ